MIAKRVASGVSALVAAPAYLERAGRPIQPAELIHHRCLRYRPPGQHAHSWTMWREGQTEKPIRIGLQPIVCSNHVESLMRIALAGGGILSVSLDLVADRLARGELERSLDGWVTEHWSLYAALPSRRYLPARTRAYLDELTRQTAVFLRP